MKMIDFKNKIKSMKVLIKRNAFAFACFLLAILVSITGTVSYSRYILVSNGGGDTVLGSFTVGGQIDNVSALSFTNTAFWGGSSNGNEEVAMSALRSVEFSVNNFEVINGVKKVAEVKTSYALSFAAPKNFIDRLAFQVFDKDEFPILPQIVVAELMYDIENGWKHDTGLTKDYHGVHLAGDIVFETDILSNGACMAFGVDVHGHNVVIVFEYYEQLVHQQLLFRTWDVTKLTDKYPYYMEQEAGGNLLAPLSVDYIRTVDFCRVTVRSDAFVMPAGVETTNEHCIHLTPTDPIDDLLLGASFVDDDDRFSRVLYGGPDNTGSLPTWTLRSIRESNHDVYYTDGNFNTPLTSGGNPVIKDYTHGILGSPVHYLKDTTVKSPPVYTKTVLQNATPHMGGTWAHEHVSEEPVDQIRVNYLYLRKNGDKWDYVSTNQPSNLDESYYRLTINGNIDRYLVTTENVTHGTLMEERTVTESYFVESVDYDSATGEDVIVLKFHENINLKETVIGPGTYTERYRLFTEDNSKATNFNYTVQQYRRRNNNGNYAWRDPSNGESANDIIKNLNDLPIHTSDTKDLEIVDNFPEDNYIYRTIRRKSNYVNIQIESMNWSYLDSNNTPVPVTFTYDSPFNLFRQATIDGQLVNQQQYFISQCYSKNYPFSVNILFEQLINQRQKPRYKPINAAFIKRKQN